MSDAPLTATPGEPIPSEEMEPQGDCVAIVMGVERLGQHRFILRGFS